MSSISRDVVIRVAVQGVTGKLDIPDLKPATSGVDAYNQATQAATDGMNAMNAATDGVVIATDNVATSAGTANVEMQRTVTVLKDVAQATSSAQVALESLAATSKEAGNSVVLVGAAFDGGFTGDTAETVEELATATAKATLNFTQAAEGAFKVARGLALATGASAETTKEMVQLFATVHSGMDVMKGATKLLNELAKGNQSLAGVAKNLPPVLGAVTVAVGAGVMAWHEYRRGIEETQKRIEDMERALSESIGKAILRNNELSIAVAQTHEGYGRLLEITAEMVRIEKELRNLENVGWFDANYALELRVNLRQQLIGLAQSEIGYIEELAAAEAEAIREKQQSLELATRIVEKERERVNSVQVAVGRLTGAESAELDRIIAKMEKKEQLSRREAERLSALGQGQLANQVFGQLAEDSELAKRVLRQRGGASQVEQLEEAQKKARESLGVKEGENPEQAVERSLKELRDRTADEKAAQNQLIRDMINEIKKSQSELSKMQQALLVKKGFGQ